MEKHILEQYVDLQTEERDLQRRIQSVSDQIRNMETEGYMVADSVTCGRKGKKPLGTKKIQGFPYPDYISKRAKLRTYKMQLELADQKMLELLSEVELWIQEIPDSRIRKIIRYRFIDGCSWTKVAYRMGGCHTADGCRMAVERFLAEK